jgi:hypothetical protein
VEGLGDQGNAWAIRGMVGETRGKLGKSEDLLGKEKQKQSRGNYWNELLLLAKQQNGG